MENNTTIPKDDNDYQSNETVLSEHQYDSLLSKAPKAENPSKITLSTNLKQLLKTSHTYPLNISWMLPASMLSSSIPKSSTWFMDRLSSVTDSTSKEKRKSNQYQKGEPGSYEESGLNTEVFLTVTDDTNTKHLINDKNKKSPGNLALSSAPGKKVRLNGLGVTKTKHPIDRDLEADFERIVSFNIRTIVNLLNDKELAYLNAPWDEYSEKADQFDIDIIRYPIQEGGCPNDMKEFDEKVIDEISSRTNVGKNVLCHCRGGVGRAGLVACCWLLKHGFCTSAIKAIQFVRARRSQKAIETVYQEEFIYKYEKYIKDKDQNTLKKKETILKEDRKIKSNEDDQNQQRSPLQL